MPALSALHSIAIVRESLSVTCADRRSLDNCVELLDLIRQGLAITEADKLI